jgi:ATPase subunit of ABC transporter with duplicated ATPase domains
MANVVSIEKLSHEWPTKRVFDGVSLGIFEGDRIGVVGKNGDGKSTLLEILAGTVTPDDGRVIVRGGTRIGFLEQSDHLRDVDTIQQALFGSAPEHEWASVPRVRQVLAALLPDVSLDTLVGNLSGGQRRRTDVARLMCGDYDVLLLDEPTNHLDMPAIAWLAQHLKRRWPAGQGALVCVTHDRWFLDEVCESMWEVHDATIDVFEGGYSAYIQQRAERARLASAREARRQSILRKELAWLSRGAQARTSKPKFRIAEAEALIADEPPLRNELELKRAAVARLGKLVFELKNVTAGHTPENPVVSGLDWLIGPGERLGILGANGAGKSTLISTIVGALPPLAGRVRQGASVRLGVLDQGMTALANKQTWTVKDVVGQYKTSYRVDGKDLSPTQLLERLEFDSKQIMARVQDLSGGQQRRLALVCVLMEEPNVLVLDEPGNDLDTDMLAQVEALLDTWPGTLLLVTHDRYLMERVTTDQFALIAGELVHMPGGVDQFLQTAQMAALPQGRGAGAGVGAATAAAEKSREGAAGAAGAGAAGAGAAGDAAPGAASAPALTGAARRDLKKRYDACCRKLDKRAGEVAALEARLLEVAPSDFETLMSVQAELDERRREVGELEELWLELEEALEAAR